MEGGLGGGGGRDLEAEVGYLWVVAGAFPCPFPLCCVPLGFALLFLYC